MECRVFIVYVDVGFGGEFGVVFGYVVYYLFDFVEDVVEWVVVVVFDYEGCYEIGG